MSKAIKTTLVISTLLSCSAAVVVNLSILEKYPMSRDKIAAILSGSSALLIVLLQINFENEKNIYNKNQLPQNRINNKIMSKNEAKYQSEFDLKCDDSDEKLKKLQAQINYYENKYSRRSVFWVCCYRTLLILSALLSASSAVIVNIGSPVEQSSSKQANEIATMVQSRQKKKSLSRNDWAAILAAASTVVTSSLGAIGLENEWRINRLARDKIRALRLSLYKEDCKKDEIISDLQNIIKERIED